MADDILSQILSAITGAGTDANGVGPWATTTTPAAAPPPQLPDAAAVTPPANPSTFGAASGNNLMSLLTAAGRGGLQSADQHPIMNAGVSQPRNAGEIGAAHAGMNSMGLDNLVKMLTTHQNAQVVPTLGQLIGK